MYYYTAKNFQTATTIAQEEQLSPDYLTGRPASRWMHLALKQTLQRELEAGENPYREALETIPDALMILEGGFPSRPEDWSEDDVEELADQIMWHPLVDPAQSMLEDEEMEPVDEEDAMMPMLVEWWGAVESLAEMRL